MGEEVLRTEGIVKKFGDFTALNRVSISINELETTSIIGPNGAGKTTLVNVVSGKLSPDEGRVFLYGKDITKLPTNKRIMHGINRTFQIPNVFQNMTVYQNILISALSKGGSKELVEKLIEDLKLGEFKDVVASKLPHGTLKILELAMALATRPQILLLDEPSSGLNPVEKSIIVKILEELGKNITLVIIEHDMDVVFNLSKRIIVLHRGECIADGTPHEISLNTMVKEIYLG